MQIHIYTQYRIRKLTPVECGRLMGVNMDDIIRMIIADHRRANEYLQYMKDNGIEYEGKKEMDELSNTGNVKLQIIQAVWKFNCG